MKKTLLLVIIYYASIFGLNAQCFNATVISIPESCAGCCDATVGLSITGGCSPSILWASGDTSMTVSNLCAGTVLDFYLTDDLSCCADSMGAITAMSSVGLTELSTSDKKLIHIGDLYGRERSSGNGEILIYYYSDGTTKKVYTIE